jgi:hypothetical protein
MLAVKRVEVPYVEGHHHVPSQSPGAVFYILLLNAFVFFFKIVFVLLHFSIANVISS